MEQTDFSWALRLLKSGRRLARAGWNGRGMWLRIPPPYVVRTGQGFEGIATSCPFIEMKTADDKFVPWLASQTDLLAEDWELLPLGGA